LTVINDCELTTFVDRLVSDITAGVNKAAATLNLFIDDVKALSHNNPTYCKARTYSFDPVLASLPFLTISLDTLTLVSTNPLETGTHVITLTVGLQDYPAVLPIVKTF